MKLYELQRELANRKTIYDLPLRVTYYARVSSTTDAQLNSIQNQISHFEDRIRSVPGWTFVPGYIDEGIRGESAHNRVEFQRMVQDGKAGLFDLILTKEISRFARNTIDSLTYTQKLLEQGVGVYFESDNLCTLDKDSDLRLTIMSSIAQEEVRKLSERVRFGHRKSIEAGKVLGNSRIFGYDYLDCRLVEHPEEAEMVRLIFRLYDQGSSLRAIARQLYELGYRNHNGKGIAHSTLAGILTNPKYKGYYCGGKVQITDYKTKKQLFLPEEEWHVFQDETGEIVPALVEEELWDRVNLLYRKRKAAAPQRKNPFGRSLFSGRIVCREHGTPFYRNQYSYKGEKKMFWYCKERKNDFGEKCKAPLLYEGELEAILTAALMPVLQDRRRFLDRYLETWQEVWEGDGGKAEIEGVEARIQQIRRRKDRLLDLSLDGKLSNQEFGRRNQTFNEELEALALERKALQEEERQRKDAKGEAARMEAALSRLLGEERIAMEVAMEIVDRIVVGQEEEGRVSVDVLLRSGGKAPMVYHKEEKLVLPSGQMVKKMIQAYENSMK